MAREGIVSSKGKHKRTRMFQGVTGRRPDNKKIRIDEAKERQEAWAKLGLKGQLTALDARLGKGAGAKRQRARLQNLIDNPPRPTKKAVEAAAVAPVPTSGEPGERVKAKDRKAQERTKRPGADKRGA